MPFHGNVIHHGNVSDDIDPGSIRGNQDHALLLVGLPLGAEGEETEMSKAARSFGRSLQKRYSIPVEYADERLSSRVAESRFAELRASGGLRRKDASQLDAMAAQVILENWLQSLPG